MGARFGAAALHATLWVTPYPMARAARRQFAASGAATNRALEELAPPEVEWWFDEPYGSAPDELLDLYRQAKAEYGDPVVAWSQIVQDPERAKAYKSVRGKGGLVRASWDEVAEIIAAAHVYTVKRWGPDRIAGFSPIPAMSPVSYASGARFLEMIGAPMLSFYDWYADLPNASPQMFGDQTDVPESGDWWDAGYLIMWGSNVPTTRTPDAHWMTEARYRGQKVVAVAPDYAENVKFADEWVNAAPGTDGALAMAMGHVILKEYFVDQQVPFFEDYNKRFTDLPHAPLSRQCETARMATASASLRIRSLSPLLNASTRRACASSSRKGRRPTFCRSAFALRVASSWAMSPNGKRPSVSRLKRRPSGRSGASSSGVRLGSS